MSKGTDHTYEGDFNAVYQFVNYRNALSTDVWDNYIVAETSNGKSALIRADNYAMDYEGAISYTDSWSSDDSDFLTLMQAAHITITVERTGTTVQYSFNILDSNGNSHSRQVTHTGVSDDKVTLHFTCEESLLDIYRYESIATIEGEEEDNSTRADDAMATYDNILCWTFHNQLTLLADKDCEIPLYDANGKLLQRITLKASTPYETELATGIYLAGNKKIIVR